MLECLLFYFNLMMIDQLWVAFVIAANLNFAKQPHRGTILMKETVAKCVYSHL